MAKTDSTADIAEILGGIEGRWSGVPPWVIFEDENGRGIVRTEDGGIIAETMLGNGTHENAVRIVDAREDIRTLLTIARAQGAKLAEFEKNAREFQAWIVKLEDACRNVLTTEPPPLNEVDAAWNTCVEMSEYQAWFHRQFNLNQVAELLEHSNDNNGR